VRPEAASLQRKSLIPSLLASCRALAGAGGARAASGVAYYQGDRSVRAGRLAGTFFRGRRGGYLAVFEALHRSRRAGGRR